LQVEQIFIRSQTSAEVLVQEIQFLHN
jgi:hypothetical protein